MLETISEANTEDGLDLEGFFHDTIAVFIQRAGIEFEVGGERKVEYFEELVRDTQVPVHVEPSEIAVQIGVGVVRNDVSNRR